MPAGVHQRLILRRFRWPLLLAAVYFGVILERSRSGIAMPGVFHVTSRLSSQAAEAVCEAMGVAPGLPPDHSGQTQRCRQRREQCHSPLTRIERPFLQLATFPRLASAP
jgi:hypothetical protein